MFCSYINYDRGIEYRVYYYPKFDIYPVLSEYILKFIFILNFISI